MDQLPANTIASLANCLSNNGGQTSGMSLNHKNECTSGIFWGKMVFSHTEDYLFKHFIIAHFTNIIKLVLNLNGNLFA